MTTFANQGGLGRGFRSRREKRKLISVLFSEDDKFWFSDQLLLLWLSKTSKNLLLIIHNDGFIYDDEFGVLYDLYPSKNLVFPYESYAPFNLKELDESESFSEFRFGKRDKRILKEVLQIPDTITCSQCSVCDGIEGLCMLLKQLSYPCRYGDMIHRFTKPVPQGPYSFELFKSHDFP